MGYRHWEGGYPGAGRGDTQSDSDLYSFPGVRGSGCCCAYHLRGECEGLQLQVGLYDILSYALWHTLLPLLPLLLSYPLTLLLSYPLTPPLFPTESSLAAPISMGSWWGVRVCCRSLWTSSSAPHRHHRQRLKQMHRQYHHRQRCR
jgi:hypothetical protein